MRVFPILTCLLALSGCGLLETIFRGFDDTEFVSRTFVLRPVESGGHTSRASQRAGSCDFPNPQLPTRGIGHPERVQWLSEGGADEIIPVSYANQLFPGADPEPCDDWQFPTLQGKATFFFGTIPQGSVIRSARLSVTSREWATDARGFLAVTRDCRAAPSSDFAEIGLAAVPVRGSDTSGALIGYTNATSLRTFVPNAIVPTNITGMIREAVARSDPEQQLIMSPKPSFRRQQHDRSVFGLIRYCALHITGIELRVTALVPRSE